MRRLQRKLEEFAGPRWPPKVRILIVLVVVIAAYVCAHWRLMHAREFGALAILFGVFLLFVRRTLWKWRSRSIT